MESDHRVVAFRNLMFAAVATVSTAAAQAQTGATSGYATQSFTPRGFQLPEGSGCAGDIARWQAIQDNDYHGGNIGLSIYRRIQAEIGQASAACAAGRDSQASALVRSSRIRHGYPP